MKEIVEWSEKGEWLDSHETRVGEKIVLWAVESSKKAYKDQFGVAHSGEIVHREIFVKVVKQEKKKLEAPDMDTGALFEIILTAVSTNDGKYVSSTWGRWGNLYWGLEKNIKKGNSKNKWKIRDAETYLSITPGPFVGRDGNPFRSRDKKISSLLKK